MNANFSYSVLTNKYQYIVTISAYQYVVLPLFVHEWVYVVVVVDLEEIYDVVVVVVDLEGIYDVVVVVVDLEGVDDVVVDLGWDSVVAVLASIYVVFFCMYP